MSSVPEFQVNRQPDCCFFDPTYIQWRARFAAFEARCFEALCDFVRTHFEGLLDRYYWEGHESMREFPAWAFERYVGQACPEDGSL